MLDRRLRELDLGPDPDGRFRVNEFICYPDTWRMALSRLLESDPSQSVLVNLRGFSADRSVVTVFGADAPLSISDHRSSGPEELARVLKDLVACRDMIDHALKDG